MVMLKTLGLVSIFAYFSLSAGEENRCSRYHYEEQILSKVVRLEHRLELLEDKVTNKTEISSQNPTCAQCPDMWIPFHGSCYRFVDEQLTYDNARSHCIVHEAHLVHVDTELENEFLNASFWIGLADINTEGKFEWDGSSKAVSFDNWGPGQPDNAGGKEHCVHYYDQAKQNYKWNDHVCGRLFKSICEKRNSS
ncbi:perlucin-like isoform X2 [Mercenaria mercenaria]|uniref:perlucin-like isoform X2 n=1 Tax=Mercenaria mercenaria TaxID=6596 RepID=UPI001E1D8A6F|nr:perlucin-like isoform X2 [Mercenaria mercenaria]